MLFNSYVFILMFLPVTAALFYLARRVGWIRGSVALLVLASLFYYGWWAPKYLILLLGMMGFTLVIARGMLRMRGRNERASRVLLVIGITGNLIALGYFKYANFVVDNADAWFGLHWNLATVILPIGISFYTFQKIAFLVDIQQHKIERFRTLDYLLFLIFFPQLIAGPIVHHSDVIPQFHRLPPVSREHVARGITFFIFGLTKKVLFADTAAAYVAPAFNAAASGKSLDLIAAWGAALAYSAQLYFDFSGYSDMAIGIGLLFGIRLPLNFNSPYKAASIIDFWRRWHMTLSRFLRDYLYVPLGGNRKGPARRYINLYITMLLGGIWHGAGWTFAVWGALHGVYLIINHAWERLETIVLGGHRLPRWLCHALTFLAVLAAWVFFRSASLGTAMDILRSMAGAHGVTAPRSLAGLLPHLPASQAPIDGGVALGWAVALLGITWLCPNTQQVMRYEGPGSSARTTLPSGWTARLVWSPAPTWAGLAAVLFAMCVMKLSHVSEFIYFQF